MTPAQIRTALEPHAKRPIRAFLAKPGDAEPAFWEAVYASTPKVEHADAVAIAAAFEASEARVATIIEGLPS